VQRTQKPSRLSVPRPTTSR